MEMLDTDVGFDATSGVTALTSTDSTKVLDAPAAGYEIFITDLYAVNDHASVACLVSLLDDTTVIFTAFAPISAAGLPPVPINKVWKKPLKVTVAKQLNIKCSAAGSVHWNVGGFVRKVYG
jgi:hypothetical protein